MPRPLRGYATGFDDSPLISSPDQLPPAFLFLFSPHLGLMQGLAKNLFSPYLGLLLQIFFALRK